MQHIKTFKIEGSARKQILKLLLFNYKILHECSFILGDSSSDKRLSHLFGAEDHFNTEDKYLPVAFKQCNIMFVIYEPDSYIVQSSQTEAMNQSSMKCAIANTHQWDVAISSIVLMINFLQKMEGSVDRQKQELTMDYLDLQMMEHLIIPKQHSPVRGWSLNPSSFSVCA